MNIIAEIQQRLKMIPSSYFTTNSDFNYYIDDYLNLQLLLFKVQITPDQIIKPLEKIIKFQSKSDIKHQLKDIITQLTQIQQFQTFSQSQAFDKNTLLQRQDQLVECIFLANQKIDHLNEQQPIEFKNEALFIWRLFLVTVFITGLIGFNQTFSTK